MEEIQKGNRARFDQIKNQVEDSFEKGKEMPIGTISNGRKKIAQGKWVPVTKEKESIKIDTNRFFDQVFSGETIRSKKDYESTFKSSIGLDDADLEMQLRLGFEKYKKSKSHDYHRLQSKPFSNHRDALIKFFKHGRDKFINKQGKKL